MTNHIPAGKYLKPYQGLKRLNVDETELLEFLRRKIPKTLSGIETESRIDVDRCCHAGKYLKPYQGLKRRVLRSLSG